MVYPTQEANWSLLLRKLTGSHAEKANWSLQLRKLTVYSYSERYIVPPTRKDNMSLLLRKLNGLSYTGS